MESPDLELSTHVYYHNLAVHELILGCRALQELSCQLHWVGESGAGPGAMGVQCEKDLAHVWWLFGLAIQLSLLLSNYWMVCKLSTPSS